MSSHCVGSIDNIPPVGEGRAYDVDGTEVAVYRLRDGTCARWQPYARTAADHWPMD